MQSYPVIAISQRVEYSFTRKGYCDVLDQNLVDWVSFIGGTAVPVPNKLSISLKYWLQRLKPDAIILSGGNDIGESLNRDETEKALLQYSDKAKLPVLGICRGMQMLAHYEGVNLKPLQGHINTRHRLVFDKQLETFPEEVNSFHGWCIACCPENYIVTAVSQDESIEAIKHVNRKWQGWMWHPEREPKFLEYDRLNATNLLMLEGA